MAKCPSCGSIGADILLQKVFCPNSTCQWFDEVTKDRFAKKYSTTVNFIDKFVKDLREQKSDPDKTPVWHPTKP